MFLMFSDARMKHPYQIIILYSLYSNATVVMSTTHDD